MANGEHLVPNMEGEGPRHILSSDQFEPALTDEIFKSASEYKSDVINRRRIDGDLNNVDPIISFFEEPSTRTRFSFEFAATRLGYNIVTTEAGKVFSSKAKGESIEDTAVNLQGYYPAAIFGRFSDTGDAQRASDALTDVPLLNGGDGKGEHPTQAYLDMFTIQEEFGTLEGHKIVLGGDLLNGRTVHSLAKTMSDYKGTEFLFVAPDELQMDPDIIDFLDERRIKHETTQGIAEALNWADVVYWTRLQAERISNHSEKLAMIEKQKQFAISLAEVKAMQKHAILLHPLPRVEPGFVDSKGDTLEAELLPEVDQDPRARYMQQSANGQFARLALLRYALEPRYGHDGLYPPENN